MTVPSDESETKILKPMEKRKAKASAGKYFDLFYYYFVSLTSLISDDSPKRWIRNRNSETNGETKSKRTCQWVFHFIFYYYFISLISLISDNSTKRSKWWIENPKLDANEQKKKRERSCRWVFQHHFFILSHWRLFLINPNRTNRWIRN